MLFDVVRAGVEFTNMKMDTLSLGLVGPGFRCQCVVIFRVIPPRKSLADAIYYEARTTMFLKRLMDEFCVRHRVEREHVYFTYGAGTRRLADTDTLFSLVDGSTSEYLTEIPELAVAGQFRNVARPRFRIPHQGRAQAFPRGDVFANV